MEELIFLTLTILFELPVALLLLRQEDVRRLVLATVSVNMISHPIAWQLVVHGASWTLVELGVCVFEIFVFAILFRRFRARAVLVAVVMNVVTAAIGYAFF